MGRYAPSTTGPADEAENPPLPVPLSPSKSESDPNPRLLRRRLAHQTALAQFARRALKATMVEPLQAEAAVLVDQVFPAPESGVSDLVSDAVDDIAFTASVADILSVASRKLDAEAASRHASLHDPLTGLANRALILDHLRLALARASRQALLMAVIFLDLDDFKPINDTLGHGAGDEILVRVAERLRSAVRPSDTLGRWGGDEFVVVCEDLERASDAPVIVARLAAAFEEPFVTHGAELHVAASIGIALSGGGDDRPTALIHAADAAMYRVKHDLAGASSREEQAPTVFPAGEGGPKQEQLISRLLDLLSAVAVAGPPDGAA